MTDRGKELMGEFSKNYPKTEGAAGNWWRSLSDEDKQEVIDTIQDAVVTFTQVWEAIQVAVMEAVEIINNAFAEFSKAWNAELAVKGFMTEEEVNEIFPERRKDD